MTARDEVYAALQKADAAGDIAGAKQLADYIRTLPADEAPAAPVQTSKASAPELYSKEDAGKNLALRLMGIGGRSLGLAGRTMLNGAMALPMMAANAGVGVRNAITGEQNEMPSKTFNDALTAGGVPSPTGAAEKVGDFLGQIMTGMGTPSPVAGSKLAGIAGEELPKIATSYKPVAPIRDATLKASQEAGYVVPPSTTNPTAMNKILESVGGKIATAQDAAVKNADVTNRLVKESLGLHPDAPLTADALKALRDEAAPAYEAIKNAGTMHSDDAYTKAIDGLGAKYQGASKSFPGLVTDQVSKLVESLKQPSFEADSAIDATKVLRENASKAYAQGDKGLGSAYKTASKALEDLVERNLARQAVKTASDAPEMADIAAEKLANFRNARALIAKTYSVENALNPATGNVSATKLASQLTRGKPLSDELKTVAQFGQAFPKAAKEITDSGSVRNTDVILGAGSAALSHDPRLLLYPFTRSGIRKLLLGPGQSMAVPAQGVSNYSTTAGGTNAAIARLLGQ
jgi:hypothetical protein